MTKRINTSHVLIKVEDEIQRANEMYGSFNSAHEGYGVLLEEVDELWAEIKSKRLNGENAFTEAIQVAAVALRIAQQIHEEKL